jgi:hypothetical protein
MMHEWVVLFEAEMRPYKEPVGGSVFLIGRCRIPSLRAEDRSQRAVPVRIR